jgi:hypothetical protein
MAGSFIALASMVCGQMALWWYLNDTSSVLMRPVIRWIKRNPRVESNVVAHMIRDLKSYGISPSSQMVEYFALFCVAAPLHHGLAVLFTFLGYWLGSVQCYCIGVTFEIGEDAMHYVQMAVTHFAGPEKGIAPWKDVPRSMWVYIGLHHSIGLVAGSFAFLCGSEWEETQLYSTLLLLCLLPNSLKLPLQLYTPPATRPSMAGKLYALSDLVTLFVMTYCRLYKGMPMGLALTRRCFNELSPASAFCVGAILNVVAPFFFAVSTILFVPSVYRGLREQFVS